MPTLSSPCRRTIIALLVLIVSVEAPQQVLRGQDTQSLRSGARRDDQAWESMTGLDAGSHPVGFRVMELEDSTRAGIGFGGGAAGWEDEEPTGGLPSGELGTSPFRRIRAWIWYPTRARGDQPMTLADYVEEAARDMTVPGVPVAEDVRVRFRQELARHGLRQEDLVERLRAPFLARPGSPPSGKAHPLLVMGQGLDYESPLSQVVLCEYLASHGFIVATAPLLGTDRVQARLTVEDLATQVGDLALLVERVPSLLPVDRSRVAVGGFDLGGMAAYLVQLQDPSIGALVSLDAGIIFAHNIALLERVPGFRGPGLTVPSLQITRDREENEGIGVEEDLRYFRNATTEAIYLVRIHGMRHPDFTSYLFFGTAPAELPFWGGEVGDPRTGAARAAAMIEEFLRTRRLDAPPFRDEEERPYLPEPAKTGHPRSMTLY